MSLYGKFVLPRLIDLAMRNPEAARLRAEWLPHAHGDVLEIGIGSGLNLAFYSTQVRRVYGVDPSAGLLERARKRARGANVEVEFLPQSAEAPLPLADASIDTAISTWTLCSVPDVAMALQQIRRVLKPGGRLVFLEHGRAPDPAIARWQNRITPAWKRIAGGCRLNRPIDALIETAGFRIGELKTFYLRGPRLMTYTYQGLAQAR